MGSYYIPSNNLKGESRILYIFTTKSLLFTGIGAMVGFVFYLIFGLILGLTVLGWILMGLFALIGYGIATIKMPSSGTSKIAKNVGGDSIDDIIKRYIIFKKNRKVYTYALPRKEPNYENLMNSFSIDKVTDKLVKGNTKEEK